jgi:hypothetical protein
MIDPPFDLDLIKSQLEKFRTDCMELANTAAAAADDLGVPLTAIDQFIPDMNKNIDWHLCPDIYDTHVEFSGEIFRYGETDYTFFHLDRRLIEGEITVDDWAADQLAAFTEAKRQHEQANLANARAERATRHRLYEELKKEFETTQPPAAPADK